MNGRGAYTRDRLNKVPPGFRGGRRDWKFILEVGQMLSGSPESGHTLVVDFLECTEIAFGRICLPRREGKLFQSTIGRKKGTLIGDKMG